MKRGFKSAKRLFQLLFSKLFIFGLVISNDKFMELLERGKGTTGDN